MDRFASGRITLFAAAMAGLAAAALPAGALDRIEIGVLECTVEGGAGYIIGSNKQLSCVFTDASGRSEQYDGTIRKLGIDIGTTRGSLLRWTVFAPTAGFDIGALEGVYSGVSAEATIGVGLGANALVGGSARSIGLQPVSIQAQTGINVAAGIASLELTLH